MMALMLAVGPLAALGETDDAFEPMQPKPRVRLIAPTASDGADAGRLLRVEAEGTNVSRLELSLSWPEGTIVLRAEGGRMEQTALLPATHERVTATLTGYGTDGQTAWVSVQLRTPRETLIDDMLGRAQAIAQDANARFMPADDADDPGTCKNFLRGLLEAFADGYALADAPDARLVMPLNADAEDCSPWRYGVQWAQAADSPYAEVGRFRSDPEQAREENARQAAELLRMAQRGDVLQLACNYVDGNGPHAILLTQDCDGEALVFADSNRKGTRVGGARYGWAQYGARWTVEFLADALAASGCGATLYRLREDITRR